MDQYINIKDIENAFEHLTDEYSGTEFLSGIYVAKTWIEHLKPADVEPMRRCKECDNFRKLGGNRTIEVNYCALSTIIIDDDDFCSFFEEKTDGKET